MLTRIYMLSFERAAQLFCFSHSKMLRRFGSVPSHLYDLVFSGDLSVKTPDDVFHIFNVSHPENYTGRCLSVSDVVEFLNPDGTSTFYYCDWTSFIETQFDSSKILNKSV